MPQNTKIFIWQPRWNMISPVIFTGALTIFAGPHSGDGAAACMRRGLIIQTTTRKVHQVSNH